MSGGFFPLWAYQVAFAMEVIGVCGMIGLMIWMKRRHG